MEVTDAMEEAIIVAYQASKRGGTLYCKVDGNRVKMSGKAALYSALDINFWN